MRVPLIHPEYTWFTELELQWYAVPIISDMMLEIGGVEFTAAPFNGWYMGTEIGSRNLVDHDRYDMLPEIARRMGLDTKSYHSLWQDRALVELNRAVLFSYGQAGVNISNHHDASEQFVHFEKQEEKHGRQAMADLGDDLAFAQRRAVAALLISQAELRSRDGVGRHNLALVGEKHFLVGHADVHDVALVVLAAGGEQQGARAKNQANYHAGNLARAVRAERANQRPPATR
jgi:hypothetical protein